MQRFPLAGYNVHRVGFGAMQLPGPGVFGPPRDRDQALAVLRRAVASGVDHIDTAQYYGPDVANELIREALHPYPKNLALVSKVGATRDDKGGWLPDAEPHRLRAGIEDNLRSLGVERLAAVNLRVLGEDEPDQLFTDQLGAMITARDEGLIGGIGLSNVSYEQLLHALEITEIACVQNPFNLIDRSSQPVLDECISRDIPFVPFFPLGSASPPWPGPALFVVDEVPSPPSPPDELSTDVLSGAQATRARAVPTSHPVETFEARIPTR